MLYQRINMIWSERQIFATAKTDLELMISGGPKAVAFRDRHSLNSLLLQRFTRVQVTLVFVCAEAIESDVSENSAELTFRRTRRKLSSKELYQERGLCHKRLDKRAAH